MTCQNISEGGGGGGGGGYTLYFSKTTLHKPQNNACYFFIMGWGVTLQKQSLIRYPKIIGNPIVYYIYQTASYSYLSILSCN